MRTQLKMDWKIICLCPWTTIQHFSKIRSHGVHCKEQDLTTPQQNDNRCSHTFLQLWHTDVEMKLEATYMVSVVTLTWQINVFYIRDLRRKGRGPAHCWELAIYTWSFTKFRQTTFQSKWIFLRSRGHNWRQLQYNLVIQNSKNELRLVHMVLLVNT